MQIKFFITSLIIFFVSISFASVNADTVKKTLSNGNVATIVDNQKITLTDKNGNVTQESTFSCGTVKQTVTQLQAMQENLAKKPKRFRAKNIAYPLLWNHNGQHIKIQNSKELAKKFNAVFTSGVQKAILEQDPYRLFANSNGNMIGNGQVWFCNQGIFSVST